MTDKKVNCEWADLEIVDKSKAWMYHSERYPQSPKCPCYRLVICHALKNHYDKVGNEIGETSDAATALFNYLHYITLASGKFIIPHFLEVYPINLNTKNNPGKGILDDRGTVVVDLSKGIFPLILRRKPYARAQAFYEASKDIHEKKDQIINLIKTYPTWTKLRPELVKIFDYQKLTDAA